MPPPLPKVKNPVPAALLRLWHSLSPWRLASLFSGLPATLLPHWRSLSRWRLASTLAAIVSSCVLSSCDSRFLLCCRLAIAYWLASYNFECAHDCSKVTLNTHVWLYLERIRICGMVDVRTYVRTMHNEIVP